MARTYLPTIFLIVRKLCVYVSRHDSTIRANLSGDALTAYNNLTVACDAFNAFYDSVMSPSS
jgi:hypothetical protein